ncbi:MAG: hypothetical protein MUE85_17370 [Microscillaceae bacterium]|jgi:hypothetical protein|nr:hypothetical protein [Microscillaceae bacterium]
MSNIDPIFVKISENHDTTDILDDLTVEPFEIKVGDTFNIGGRFFSVNRLKDEQGNFQFKESSDLKGNVKAYEELIRTGVVPEVFRFDDLYLKNVRNGDALVEITIPDEIYTKVHYNQVLHSNQRSFFVRFDNTMLNSKIKEKNIAFDEVEIKLTPCMFASDSALAFTESGRQISITERNTVIDEAIFQIITAPHFTLYEREIVSRLVGTTNLLAYNQKIDKVTTALPRGAYYSFVFQGAADGFISPEQVLDWFDKVDARVKFLRLLIKKGIHQYHPQMPIEQYSFMDAACEVMREYFEQRLANPSLGIDLPSLFDLVLNTIIDQDSFAKQVFESGVAKPATFHDLCNFTYSIGNLTDMELQPDKPLIHKQIIGVYDVTETMMWIEAKRIRNRGLLEFRGQFNPKVPQNTTYDNLSFVSVMPIEHVIFDISPEFAEKYMGGFTRLYSVRHSALTDTDAAQILGQTQWFDKD